MELPDDVLRLVREYSRPCFKYFREYNRLVKRFGPLSHLKEKLQADPSFIVPFLAYEKALIEWREVKHLPMTTENGDKFRRLMNAIYMIQS